MKRKVIIDADTGNEIDDLYAIARALKTPEFDILGLCAAHYRAHDEAPADSAGVSLDLNLELLEKAERNDIPAFKGSNLWMGKAWGGQEPADSPAAQFIIKSAQETCAHGEKLHIIVQGAMTNVASAIALEPSIAKKIEIYLMGFKYDLDAKIWNKNDFNVRNDLNAADFLLNNTDVNLHIMTSTTSVHYMYPRTETFSKLEGAGPLQDMLVNRWKAFCPASTHWIMWDLALVQAMINPSLATTRMVITPPENEPREVEIYDSIDIEGMIKDFFDVVGKK